MNTKITITLLAAASFLFAANVIKAQTCGSSQVTYTTTSSQNFLPKWNATAGCISNSSIFDNGNVGVGNSSPIYPFEISPVVTAGNLSSGGTWDVGLSVGANGSIGQQSTNKHAVFGTIYANKDILFANYDGTTFNERMRIVSGGNVGIGTTAPSATLQLKAATSKEFQFGNTAGAYTSSTYFTDLTTIGPIMNFSRVSDGAFVNSIFNYTGTGSLDQLGIASRNDIVFVSSNSPTTTIKENMRITGGNVGIGTSAPATKLHIAGDAASVDLLKLQNTNGTNPRSYRIGPGAGIAAGFGIYDDNAAATRMVINFSGNVGIGLNNPAVKLEVTGDFNVNGIATCTNMNWSDSIVKTNIDSLHNALTTIGQLIPKSFYFDTANIYGLNFSSKKQYGFIAQDVETVLPELLLSTTKNADVDTLGNIIHPAVTLKTLNYSAFIGILTKGIQELNYEVDSLQSLTLNQDSVNASLQNQVNQLTTIANNQNVVNMSLQNQLDQLASLINDCCHNYGNGHGNNLMQTDINNYKSISSETLTDVELSNKNIIVLNQNVPNPFAEQTTISYYLPDNVQRAQIQFFEQSGKMIKTVDLTEKGKATLNVFANDLSKGIYTYSLIIDGQTVETKKMVKQ